MIHTSKIPRTINANTTGRELVATDAKRTLASHWNKPILKASISICMFQQKPNYSAL